MRMGGLEIHLDQQLGRGSLGAAVYRGSFRNIDVAVKSVPNAYLTDNDGTRPEDGILQSLHHDNLVNIYHIERSQQLRFYVLELCNSTLQHCFLPDDHQEKYHGPLPPEVEGMLQIVSGLEYLHSKNILHGNIKPKNIMISAAESTLPVLLKLGDFGLTSDIQESLSVWTAPETIGIMDDMQRLGSSSIQSATTQSDIWSLGCVLFFFLQHGRHPFGDRNIIKNIVEGNPNLLRELQEKSTNYMWKLLLIGQLIERDAKDRLQLSQLKSHLELVLCYMNETDETVGRSSLHFAAELESSIAPALMEEFLSGTTNVNAKDEHGRTPLEVVTANKSRWASIMTQQLLQKGGKVDESSASVKQSVSSAQQSPPSARHFSFVHFEAKVKKTDEGHSIRKRCQTMPAALTRSTSSPIEIIQQILNIGRDVNERDRSGRTPLHYAVCIVHQSAPEIVKFLIEKGASVGIKDELGRTPLHSAILVESDYALKIVQILLEKSARENINQTDRLGWTPLHLAVQNERRLAPEIVRLLITKGAKIEIKDASGKNPLHSAIENQSKHTLEIVQLLLTTTPDASINEQKKFSCSPLFITNYVLLMLRILLEKEPVEAVKAKDRYGRTPLHYAACIVHQSAPKIVHYLVEKGATVDIRDGGGRTALHAVMRNESPHALEIAWMLLDQRDNTNEKDNFGSTPLHLAVRNRHESAPNMVRLLLEKGASVTAEDNYGRTPLLLATTNDSNHAMEIVRILLDRGADANGKDKMDRTPLHWATENKLNALDIIRIILANGGDQSINIRDKNGLTPIHCSKKKQSQLGSDVLQLLLSAAEQLKCIKN